MDGTFIHQDSHGGGGTITNGDTQWMTAGSGLLHIETPPESLVLSGGLFHGLQLWVNLPKADKMMPPKYQDLRASGLRLLTSEDGGALIRLIAGDLGGHVGPGATHTPITMAHVSLTPGAQLTLPWRPDFNALAYGLAGSGFAGPEARPFAMGQAVVFGRGDSLTVHAAAKQDSRSANFEFVLLGGLPIREPMMQYGPFVMNTHTELAQAFDDFQAGRLGTIPADSPYAH
jgi:redox-sensitive bicupin YhaK (pirin superfamily)